MPCYSWYMTVKKCDNWFGPACCTSSTTPEMSLCLTEQQIGMMNVQMTCRKAQPSATRPICFLQSIQRSSQLGKRLEKEKPKANSLALHFYNISTIYQIVKIIYFSYYIVICMMIRPVFGPSVELKKKQQSHQAGNRETA